MRRIQILGPVLAILVLGSCRLAPPTYQDTTPSIEQALMKSFAIEQNGGRELSTAFAPFTFPRGGRSGAKAAINVSQGGPYDFTAGPHMIANYPEAGQTTSYTVAATATANVYRVDVTTSYPADDIRDHYSESYYVRDIAALGTWDANDPIVNGPTDLTQNQAARILMEDHFRDGSVRHETIVSVKWAPDGFGAFDLDGSLDYPALFYPATDASAIYSSVVVYTEDVSLPTAFWFWTGSQTQKILGVRYYTEHYSGGPSGTYSTSLILFEKTLSDIGTVSVDLTTILMNILPGSQYSTLANSVLRQRIDSPATFDGSSYTINTAGATRTTRIKTHVVDISTNRDFELSKINDETTQLLSFDGSLAMPTGGADEIAAQDPSTIVFNLDGSTITSPDGATIPTNTVVGAPTDLSSLYTAITEGALAINIPPASDIPGTIDSQGVISSFSGSQGHDAGVSPAFDLLDKGTVEAWVYVNAHTDTAGIVHKGSATDFSDEAYSLQFYGANGRVCFAPVTQTPYNYDLVLSTINLNTHRWYYLVGTWDAADHSLKLYIDGALNKSGTLVNCPGGSWASPGPLMIGSQFLNQAVNGYYGFDGKINGVKVSTVVKSAADVLLDYNAYKGFTSSW